MTDTSREAALTKAERLARAMDNVRSGGRDFNRQLAAQVSQELRRMEAGNERLREALRKLERICRNAQPDKIADGAQIARAALDGGTDD